MRQQSLSKYLAGLGLAILLLTHLAPRQGLAIEPLVPLAQPGPWSAVDAIIGYGPRIWFANSELFRNHNAADIYSYDPTTGALRYERALFSQGARPAAGGGRPALLALRGSSLLCRPRRVRGHQRRGLGLARAAGGRGLSPACHGRVQWQALCRHLRLAGQPAGLGGQRRDLAGAL